MPTNAPMIDDPNVKIPDAIKRTAAAADEIHKQVYSKDAAEPAKEPAKSGDQMVTLTSNSLTKNAPLVPPVAAEPDKTSDIKPEVPREGITDQPKDQNWEHAFKSVNGRYQRAQETLRNNASEIANLQSALQQANARIQHLEAQNTRPTLPADSDLTPKEREDYGEEFLNVVAKQAKRIATEQTASLQHEVADLKNRLQNVGKTMTVSARDAMKKVLDEHVPNWREINDNPEFLSYLGLRDPFSGVIRHNMLKQAWSANETDRVLAFFKGFQTEEASLAPANRPDNSAGGNPPAPGKVPLENFAAPGRASPAAANSLPAEKPSFTGAQISKFHNEVARGLWRGREDEKHKMDLAIVEAAREGRIRQ